MFSFVMISLEDLASGPMGLLLPEKIGRNDSLKLYAANYPPVSVDLMQDLKDIKDLKKRSRAAYFSMIFKLLYVHYRSWAWIYQKAR